MFKDKELRCNDCGSDFIFSAREQEFYASKGFENEPSVAPIAAELENSGIIEAVL